VKHRVVYYLALLAAVMAAGCYLYSPDVILDSSVKQQPREYICSSTASHPAEALRWQMYSECPVPKDALDPISLVPNPNLWGADTFRDDRQLTSAIAYAEYAKDQYMTAKRQGGTIPPFLATVLAPLSGAALALGSLGTGSTAVTALGVAGGSIVGVGSVVQSKDREKIYVTGAEGIQCMLTNMEPYTYIDRRKLSDLEFLLNILASDRLLVDTLTSAVQSERQPVPCKKNSPILNLRAKLLEAAKAGSKAAATTNDIGTTFLRTAHDSPATIVYMVDRINNNVSDSIIGTEPDVQSLAKNLQNTIQTEQQAITAAVQSVPNAQSSNKDAAAQTPSPNNLAPSSGGSGPVAVHVSAPPKEAPSTVFPPPYRLGDIQSAMSLDDQLSQALLNTAFTADQILDIVGSNVKPPANDSCPTLAKKSGVPTVLTLVPSGAIVVSKGGKADVTVAGAANPYVMPLFGQDQPKVTATLKENSVLEIAATKDATSNTYPFFVGDGPNGKPVTAVILYAKDACPSKPGAPKPHAPKPGAPKPGAPAPGAPGPAAPAPGHKQNSGGGQQ
jgi:hypothetical protein